MSVALSIFRVLAASTSAVMILSPMPTMYRIARAGIVGHHSIVPLVTMLANCHINMLYGYMVHNIFPIFATFVFGDVLSLLYIAIFYYHTTDRTTANKAIAWFVGPLALVTAYAAFGPYWLGQTREQIGQIIGYLGIVSTVALYSAPFEKVALVLQHRSAVFLNIHMVVTGTITNSTWVTYGALARDWSVVSRNIYTVVAGLIQIALYLMYRPSKHPLEDPTVDGFATGRIEDAHSLSIETDEGRSSCTPSHNPAANGDFGAAFTPRPVVPFRIDWETEEYQGSL